MTITIDPMEAALLVSALRNARELDPSDQSRAAHLIENIQASSQRFTRHFDAYPPTPERAPEGKSPE